MEEPTQPRGTREDDESDLFSVKSYSTTANSIPVISYVPPTKEEVKRRRVMRLIFAIIALALATFATWLFFFVSHVLEVDAAVEAAGDDGRVESVRSALALLEDDDDDAATALKLRLRSMLVLVGEDEPTEPIASALSALPGDDDVQRERGIASTYLALASGDLSAAMDEASRIDGSGQPEAARARALAARAVGNVELAILNARIAAQARPDSPRHVALFAEITARNGDPEAALARLDELPEGPRENAATLAARARIVDQVGGHAEEVSALATRILEDETSTDHEKAWARLLLGRAAAAAGDRALAREQLDQATEVAPPGDELFTLGLTEAALRIGATHLAQQVAAGLPSPLSVDAQRRAQLNAELALARRDLRAVEAALEHAPDGARTALARARLLEARDQIDAARALYLEAANDPAYRIPATSYLASMELHAGRAAEAVAQVAPLLERYPQHPDIVPVAVEAQLGLGHAEPAMALVTPALTAHPEDVRLLAAKAHVEMRLEQWENALSTLDSALRIQSDDAELHADRGRAARQLERFEVAREAFDAALALDESLPAALIGRMELDLLDFEPGQAAQMYERIERAEIDSLEVDRLASRLFAMDVAGQSKIRELRRKASARDDDYVISMNLGWLYMQSEQFANAVRQFGHAEQDGVLTVDANLARALAQIRMRASAPAAALIESVQADLDEETLAPVTRAQLHAILGRLALNGNNRAAALREARIALEHDRRNTEAHLLLGELAGDEQSVPHYEAALVGLHPSSRPLALLAIREEVVTDATCSYANRYRRAAPQGQFARGVWRVQRDCRQRGSE